ncbi:MAG: bifunctional demethylmenaquinone methyltransferase/2-methoxy-6-polyprenyl-1,4-benzoquinol methylase UbiE [Desulfomonilaceae bacterium]
MTNNGKMPSLRNSGKQIDSLLTSDQNRDMFNNIAPYYDGANRILSLGLDRFWRRAAVKELCPQNGHIYLDVGCGTGDICLEILNQSQTARVIGIDPSLGMLEIGWKKIRQYGVDSQISLRQGNCLDLDFPDNSFDGAITVFCIRNVTDHKRAFSEIVRVLKPGAKLVVTELTEPMGSIMKPLFRIYAKTVMPSVTKIMSSVSAYKYLADSMAAFPQPERIKNLMVEAGMCNVGYFHMTLGIVTIFEGSKNY